jgi:homoserine O-acetyltransferase/O-succinyltransferase
MRNLYYALVMTVLFAEAAHGSFPPATEADFVVHDFRFASGETMAEVKLHYATVGTPRRDASGKVTNAVLILHGTGGSSRQFLNDRFAGVLFNPGGVLDADKYFLILPDNIGHGHSSKPSDGLHARFPHYAYADMVELQHRLIIDGLHLQHLFLVMGTSMGGMQTWLWGERFPEMMNGLVPLASLPVQITGRNRVWRKMLTDLIRNDPTWADGEYTAQPKALLPALDLLLLATSSPLQWQKEAPTRDAADQWLSEQLKTRLATTDANDLLYAMEASRDYDPEKDLAKIRAPLLAINSADDFVNPPELKVLEKLITTVRNGRAIVIPISNQTHGHGTHTWAAVWQAELRAFVRSLG